ncbi:MAG: sulfurtransferase, partial [Candidatus Puniceispirillaceae bacterium]
GLRAGHIPGSLNLPINALLDAQTGKLKTAQELQKLFDDAGFDMQQPTVTTCGSGVTAAGLTLALAILGKTDIRLFDGSWSQWGASDAPIA